MSDEHNLRNIIVTGSSGFVASHLCRRLSAGAHIRLMGVDRLPPPQSDPRVLRSMADIRHKDELLEIAAGKPAPVLIHLAAKAEVVLPFHEYMDAMTTNVDGTIC